MEQLETTQPLTLAPCKERIEAIADEAATGEADAGWAIRITIGGAASIAQPLKGVKLGGVITIIGFLTSSDKQPALMEALNPLCIVRGIFAGSKVQFGEMNRAIDSIKMKPVVDSKIFSFEEVKEAYRYQWDKKKFGEVVIQIGD